MTVVIDLLRFVVAHIERYVYTQKAVADILVFIGVLAFTIVLEVRRTRSAARFRQPSFRTDLLYSFLYLSGFYSLFVGLPIYRVLTRIGIRFVPFLRTQALAGLPAPVQFIAALLAADFTYYMWHRTVHATPILWAFHSIHHSQQHMTIATSLRVHLFEETVRGLFYFVPFFVLGLPGSVWLPLDIAINWLLFLEHSDLDWTYGPLGRIIVSPHYHRVHHSIAESDYNKNFGSFLSFWDPLFGTASKRATRPEAYGAPQMNVPESFVRQFFYPFLWLCRRVMRSSAPRPEAVVTTTPAASGE